MSRRSLLIAFLLIAFVAATAAYAQEPPTYDIQKDLLLFGNLNQNQIPIWGANACGPTAAINSFVYLQNKYPGWYDSKLIGDADGDGDMNDLQDLIAVANTLGGAAYMNTIVNTTTYHDDFIWGKQAYIENQAPGVTVYEAQDIWAWNNLQRPMPTWVTPLYPTWGFLYNELVDCEDVEILLSWSDGGHYLTVSSFHWTDANSDGIIDVAENASIDYIDPCTGAWGQTNIWHAAVDGGWKIETAYNTYQPYISMAVSESPVPEPCTMLVLGFGCAGIAGLARRRSRKA
ncbi:MAG TPA: PEP-CTERM sorting domain-containing protein [Armatimonadota bacterium]|nr:PEP-CTERM sorting domain-containing protein [Armatimonadota bacterium]